MKLDRY